MFNQTFTPGWILHVEHSDGAECSIDQSAWTECLTSSIQAYFAALSPRDFGIYKRVYIVVAPAANIMAEMEHMIGFVMADERLMSNQQGHKVSYLYILAFVTKCPVVSVPNCSTAQIVNKNVATLKQPLIPTPQPPPHPHHHQPRQLLPYLAWTIPNHS